MKRISIILLIAIGSLAVCGWYGDKKLKGLGHPGLATFLHQWWVNYPASFAVEPQVLSIEVDEQDMETIQAVVDAARERGVIMPDGNDYVTAVVKHEGGSFKAKVRIKGKMSDHVKGDKWSFRVIAKKDNGFLGMQRFSLQHPGTRNYLCDWFYHRLSAGEGIIALRYGFIRLEFNGEDLGVYAYEEHFGPELLAHNSRMKGPLFRFDPGLFWEHRLNMINKVRYDEAFGTYQAAAVDAFGSSDLAKDSTQRVYFEEAVGLIDAFRRGERSASQVFDVDLIARRHALLDLVGGHHSMDWSDVKFYYDPVLKRVEPVAYESFSAFPIRTIAGAGKFEGQQLSSMDLHEAYFNDEDLFRAYVEHLERIAKPAYLDSAFQVLKPALDSASAVVYREFPYKELDRSIYYRNQEIIRRILDVPKGFHAYFNGGEDTLNFTLIPIESLPMEVHGLLLPDGKLVTPVSVPGSSVVLPVRPASGPGIPVDIRIPMNSAVSLGKEPFKLQYSVLGASARKAVEVFPYAYLDGSKLPNQLHAATELSTLKFLRVDDIEHTIRFVPGAWNIIEDLVIPAGYRVHATAPLHLDLSNSARIISYSTMEWIGLDDMPIVIGSSDRSGGGIMLLDGVDGSKFRRVRFEGFGTSSIGNAALLVQEVNTSFEHCDFGEDRERDLLLAVRSDIRISGCSFTGGMDQLALAYCDARISGTTFFGAGDDAVSVKGGACGLIGIRVEGALGSGLKLDEFAQVEMERSHIIAKKSAVHVAEASQLRATGGSVQSQGAEALQVEEESGRHGPSSVEWIAIGISDDTSFDIGKGNSVIVNGKKIPSGNAPPKK